MIRRFLKMVSETRPGKTQARIPGGLRIYAIGDIHGRLDLLEECHAKIVADAKDAEHQKIIQIFLGDYVDRGSDAKGVVNFLIEPPPSGWQRICLKGNHEAMVLKFLDCPLKPKVEEMWYRNGGLETLHSYGAGIKAAPKSSGGQNSQEEFSENLPESHLEFFSNLRLSVEFGDYFFVHAGVRPGIDLQAQAEEDLLWIRKDFITSKKDFGKIIVHGHTPTQQPEIRPNRINIDTGAWISGKLSCLVLEGEEQRFL